MANYLEQETRKGFILVVDLNNVTRQKTPTFDWTNYKQGSLPIGYPNYLEQKTRKGFILVVDLNNVTRHNTREVFRSVSRKQTNWSLVFSVKISVGAINNST